MLNMSVFKNLLSASYNGIPFLTPDETRTGGKKTVGHEYPSANKRRYVEELGAQAGTFSVTAIIHGADAIQKRINFEQELDKAGRGLLIHPVYGQIMVVATDWSSRSSDTDIGEFKFSITFKESEENITLSATVDSTSLVSNITEQTKVALDAAFVDQFIDLKTPYILQASTQQLLDTLTTIESFPTSLEDIIPANITTLDGILDIAENTSSSVVRSGASFIQSMRGAYNALENASANIGSFYSGFLGLTIFGNDRVSSDLTTQKRINEENNLSVFEDLTRVNALASAYEAATYADYETADELITTKEELEQTYDTIIATSADNGLIFNPDVKSLMNELRSTSRKVFDQKQQNTWRVVDVQSGESSLALTSYRYYESIDNIGTLANLNPNVNFSISDSDIKGIS